MSRTNPEVVIRTATPEDAVLCGQICYDAFYAINTSQGFPFDLPGPAAGISLLTTIFSSPDCYSVVAELDGRVVGSNCLDESSVIRGVGPITIDPAAQNLGVGRKLMQAVMDRAAERDASGTRLVQAAFHNRSFSLYSLLGFDVRESLACMQGLPMKKSIPGCSVRPALPGDQVACNKLSNRVHGFDRAIDLEEGIQRGTAVVVEREDRITGYTTHLGFFGHSTAESNVDLQALIASAGPIAGPGILVPSRNSELLRWCLENGLRVVQPMTLMSTGFYKDPDGAWLPSVIF